MLRDDGLMLGCQWEGPGGSGAALWGDLGGIDT